MSDKRPPVGVIDLLYRTEDREGSIWQVVDFKTDHIESEDELQTMVGKYEPQMRHYAYGVSTLLGGRVATTLCFLDHQGTVRWVDVETGR